MEVKKYQLSDDALKYLQQQGQAASARGARANAQVEASKGNTAEAAKWTAMADEIDQRTGYATDAKSDAMRNRQYVVTGNEALDARNELRLRAGLDPVYTNVLDQRNQARLDEGLGLSRDITPQLKTIWDTQRAYTNYLEDQDIQLRDIDSKLDDYDRWQKELKQRANLYDEADVWRQIYENQKEIKKLKTERDQLAAKRTFAYENSTVFNIAARGDTGLFEAYRDAYYTNQGSTLAQFVDTAASGNNNTPAYSTEAQLKLKDAEKKLKDKGYTDADLQAYLNVRNTQEFQPYVEEIQEWANQNIGTGALATIASVASAPVRGISSVMGMVLDPGTRNSPYSLVSNMAKGVQETLVNSIKTDVTSWAAQGVSDKGAQFIGNAAAMMYQAAVASMESALNMNLGGQLGEVLMGLDAASSTYYEGLNNGLDAGHALTNALASGAFETIFEHLSMENLRGFKKAAESRNIFRRMASLMFTEGSEEFFTDIANELYDYMANGGLSAYERFKEEYLAQNKNATERDAQKAYAIQFSKQLGQSFIVGALSGGMHGGVMSASMGLQNRANTFAGNYGAGANVRDIAAREGTSTADVLQGLTAQVQEGGKAAKALSKLSTETETKQNAVQRLASAGTTVRTGKAVNAALKELSETQRNVMIEALQEDGTLSKTDAADLLNSYTRLQNDTASADDMMRIVANTNRLENMLEEIAGSTEYQARETATKELLNKIAENTVRMNVERVTKAVEKTLGKKKVQDAKEAAERSDAVKEAIKTGTTEELQVPTYAATATDVGDVQLGAIKSVEDGKVQVIADESGATVDLNDVTFSDTTDGERSATIYNTLRDMMTGAGEYRIVMSVEGANAALAMLQGSTLDAGTFLRQFYDAYQAGTVGRNIETFMFDTDYDLSNEELAAAYSAGAKEYNVKPGITRIGTKELTGRQKKEVEVLEPMLEKLGVKLILVDSLVSKSGEVWGEAYGSTEGDVIVLALESIGRENLISVTGYHELFHWMGKVDPQGQKALIKSVVETLKKTDGVDYKTIYDQKAKVYKNASEAQIEEEIACQYLGTILASNQARIAAAQAGGSVWQKALAHLKEWFSNIKQEIKTKFASDMAVQAALMQDAETAEKQVDAFLEMLKNIESGEKRAESGETDNSFAGILSETADMTMLQQAEQMEEDGATSEEIRQATGWFKGYDNKWRYEIDDSKSEIDTYTAENVTWPGLYSLFKNDNLYEAYPWLATYHVVFKRTDGTGERGRYLAGHRRIEVSEELRTEKDELKKTLIHEIQHAIQSYEGFARGTNLEEAKDLLAFETKAQKEQKKEITKFEQNLYEKYGYDLVDAFRYASPMWEDADEEYKTIKTNLDNGTIQTKTEIDETTLETLFGEYMSMSAEMSEATKEAIQYDSLSPAARYWITAGEIEARNAAARANLTAAERKEYRPDIDKRDVLFAKLTYGENADEEIIGEDAVYNSEGDFVAPLYSLATYEGSDYVQNRDKMVEKIMQKVQVDEDTARTWLNSIDSIAAMIANNKDALDYDQTYDEGKTALKKNSEYRYTLDFSTLCAKRLLFTGTFNEIQKALPKHAFTSEELVELRKMMQDRGYQVACGICYVESTRREMGPITEDFIERYKEAQRTGQPIKRINSEGEEVTLRRKVKKGVYEDLYTEDGYTPTLGELNTTDIDNVRIEHPDVYDAYIAFMNARGQAKPKLLETRTAYKGEILRTFADKRTVNARNRAGGLRVQSFSDFEIVHLIDMMQVVMDMSVVGLRSQAYTKVPAFAEAMGNTGMKINLSLIAKGTGLDKNGNLIFDRVEGMDEREAFRLREKFSENVGTILVGVNDAHILAAMADPRIDFIIPFHKSSWRADLYEQLGIRGYEDYTETQNEKWLNKDGEESKRKCRNLDPSSYWRSDLTGDENAQIYLEKCEREGRRPKFPQFAYDEQGNVRKGYWKLLIDFKMYDNNGVGAEQKTVKPIFDDAVTMRMMDDYAKTSPGAHNTFPVAQDVVKDFVKTTRSREMGRQIEGLTQGVKTSWSLVDDKYMAAVESGDTKTQERLVAQAAEEAMPESRIRTGNGKLRTVYHGTNSDTFTVFDRSLIGSAREDDVGFFGRGFYFAFEKGEASIYGKNVISAYLNIKNPFVFENELRRYDGERAHTTDAMTAMFIVNFADKFPELADKHKVTVTERGSYDVKELSLKEFADVFKKVYNENEFRVNETQEDYGKGWIVLGDKVTDSYTDAEGKTHAFEYYDFQQKFFSEESARSKVEQTYAYINKMLYTYIRMPLKRTIIQETAFTDALISRGYDGVLQSEGGDEIVAFYPEQIKSADPVTYDDDGNVIPLSERFNSEKNDIRYSLVEDAEAEAKMAELRGQNEQLQEELQNLNAMFDAYKRVTRQREGKVPSKQKMMDILKKYMLNDPKSKDRRTEMAENIISLLNRVMDGSITFNSFSFTVWDMMVDEVQHAGHWENIGDNSAFKKEFRVDGKMAQVYLDQAEYDKVAKQYGGRSQFRKDMFPKLNVTTDKNAGARSLQDFYEGLVKKGYGLEETDAPLTMIENMMAKYKEETRLWTDDDVPGNLGKSAGEIAEDMSMQLLTDILSNANVLNGIDTELYTERIAELQAEVQNARQRRIEKALDNARKEARQQTAQLEADETLTSSEIDEKSREIELRLIRENLARDYQERMRAYEKQSRRAYQTEQERKDIRRRVRKLSDMLIKNTKTKNVPQPMKKYVKEIIMDHMNDDGIFSKKEMETLQIDLARLKTPDVNGPTFDFTRFSEALRDQYLEMKNDMTRSGQMYGVGMRLADMTPTQVDIMNAFTENVLHVVEHAGETFLEHRNGNIMQDGESVIKNLRKVFEGMSEKEKKRTRRLINSMMKNDYMTSFYFFKEHMGGMIGDYFDMITLAESNEGIRLREIEDFFSDLKEKYDYDKNKWGKESHLLHLPTYESRIDENGELPVVSIKNWDVDLSTEACMQVYAWYRREVMSGQQSSHLVPYINKDGQVFGGGVVLNNDLQKYQSKLSQAADEIKAGYKASKDRAKGTEEYIAFLKEKENEINVAADKNRHLLTEGAVEAIIESLTEEQKKYVEEVTDFLSHTCGEWGNDATMKWYGVRFFEEDYYFPYETPSEFSSRRYGLTNEKRLGSWGPTHRTNVYAHTPLVLSSFTETASRHAYEMATYSEFLVPIEQMTSLLSYSNLEGEDASVQSMVKSVYGDRALSYISNFMTQLNGGVKGDEVDSLVNRLTGKFKAGAVMANFSVVIQQPSAVLRATAMIDPKYFFKRNGLRKADYEEMVRHSGVAVIKEIGGFDTDIGSNIAKTLSGQKSKMDKVNDLMGWGAEKADSLTWTWIWNACKNEMAALGKEYVYDKNNQRHRWIAQTFIDVNIKEGTAEFDEAIKQELFLDDVRARFEDVVHRTQVYDSVISKNRWMRSETGLLKMLTAFMAEPTMSLNMLMMSGKGKTIAKRTAIAAFVGNIIVNSALRSIVSMWRHRDEDETYFESWVEEFISDLIGDSHVLFLDGAWSPFGMIPLIKDIVSILQGYDVERSDISVVGDVAEDMMDIVNSITGDDKDITTWFTPDMNLMKDLAFDVGKMFGMPAGNVYRDGSSIARWFDYLINDPKWGYSMSAFKDAVLRGLNLEQSDEYRAYMAVLKDDEGLIKRMTAADQESVDKLMAKGYSEEEAIKQAEINAADNFDDKCKDGLIRYDPDKRAQKAAECLNRGTLADLKEYDAIRQDMLNDGFSNNAVQRAINECYKALQAPEEKEAKEKTQLDAYTTAVLDDAMDSNDKAAFDYAREKLLNQGTTEDAINKHVNEKITDMFKDNEITMDTAIKMYQDYGGKTEAKAEERARDVITELLNKGLITSDRAEEMYVKYGGWDAAKAESKAEYSVYIATHPDTQMTSDSWDMYTKVYKRVGKSFQDMGMDAEAFAEYRVRQADCVGEDKDGDGYADTDTVKKQVLVVINDLVKQKRITKEQADAIYLSRWAEKNSSGISLKDTPWHK